MEKSFTTEACRHRRWRKENQEKYLRGNRFNTWKRLGLDPEEAEHLREAIKECQICGSIENLHVDHCHISNKIRGMLCRNCNHGLGNFKDDPLLLQRALDYVRI